jgi:hypothetical protein
MVGCSTIETVHIKSGLKFDFPLSKSDVQKEEYYGFGIDKVISFEVHGSALVLNITTKR